MLPSLPGIVPVKPKLAQNARDRGCLPENSIQTNFPTNRLIRKIWSGLSKPPMEPTVVALGSTPLR